MNADQNPTTTHPSAPMNDREFAVWEHGRIQGHNEARRKIDRLRVAAVKAVMPLEVIRISGFDKHLTEETRQAVADGIEAVRSAIA